MKLALWIALSTALVRPAAVSASRIVLTLTPGTNSIAVDVNIDDNGGAPDCYAFGLRRVTYMPCEDPVSVACIPRQMGTVSTHHFVDPVQPNHGYMYEVVGYGVIPVPVCVISSDRFQFQQTFDPLGWSQPILAFASIGPDAVPVARGTLSYSPQDPLHEFVLVTACSGTCMPWPWVLNSGLLAPYIDTGIEVAVYGHSGWFGNYYGFGTAVDRVERDPCPTIAVQAISWGTVKRLYRDPAR